MRGKNVVNGKTRAGVLHAATALLESSCRGKGSGSSHTKADAYDTPPVSLSRGTDVVGCLPASTRGLRQIGLCPLASDSPVLRA